MSRVDAVNVAIDEGAAGGADPSRPLAGSVAASDAFFPFRDGLDCGRRRRRDRRRSAGRIGA